MLWNQLAHKQAFSLLCGYAMGSFYKDSSFQDIRGQHSHVVSADGSAETITNTAVEALAGATAERPSAV